MLRTKTWVLFAIACDAGLSHTSKNNSAEKCVRRFGVPRSLPRMRQNGSRDWSIRKSEAEQLDAAQLRAQPRALQRRTIQKWLQSRGVVDLDFDLIERVRASARSGNKDCENKFARDRHVRRRAEENFYRVNAACSRSAGSGWAFGRLNAVNNVVRRRLSGFAPERSATRRCSNPCFICVDLWLESASMSSAVRVRFAPSPTGYLHIGGARTALFNWLYAKHTGGTLVLRIEDTDRARNTEEAARAIYDGLRWLGLDWDEGPEAGGNFGPYFQSEREAIYQSYLDKLRVAGRVYDDAGSVRFRFAREKVVVDDVICGRIEFDMASAETNPDMTIRRPDGSWIFHFVNVVDDIEMKISHVIRGEDHLSNTPKHVQLYRAFGATPPRFAHIPLILNKRRFQDEQARPGREP